VTPGTISHRYCLATDGSLDLNNALVRAEMPVAAHPRSALGYIYAGLKARLEQDVPPFAVLSCDNMPGNGTLTRRCLLEFIEHKVRAGDGTAVALGALVENGNVAFPNTMVDRITPGTEPAHRQLLVDEHGIEDECPVCNHDLYPHLYPHL
jgi:mannitol-1-phosphate/altronate dehydrogenase